DVLINNAGFGTQERFVDIPWEKIAEQIQLNVVSVTELTHRFAKAMLARDRGFILNVASVGAYVPSPDYATYSAGKAFVRDFTEAVSFELRATNVRLTAVCSGLTATEFHQVAGHTDMKPMAKATMMSSMDVVDASLKGLLAGK